MNKLLSKLFQINFFATSLLILACSEIVFANQYGPTQWAQNSLWKAPVPSKIALESLQPTDDLAAACAAYAKVSAAYSRLPAQLRASTLERERSAGLTGKFPPQRDFLTQFKMSIPVNGNLESPELLRLLSSVAKQQVSAEGNPMFVQTPFSIMIGENSFKGSMVAGKNSFVAETQSLGLETPLVEVVKLVNGFYLVAHTKDVACDLISNLSQVEIKVEAVARLDIETAKRLKKIYVDISDEINPVLTSYSRPIPRALMIGFRLGGYLETLPNIKKEQIPSFIEQYVENWFDQDTMTPNNNWEILPDQGYHLKFSQESNPFTVDFITTGNLSQNAGLL